MAVMHGRTYDDLDGGVDGLEGYRSVLRGPKPTFQGFTSQTAELEAVVGQAVEWAEQGGPKGLAVCVPTKDLVARVPGMLAEAGLPTVELTPDGPKGAGGFSIGTMHRFKGLEFQPIIIAGASDGLIPRSSLDRMRAEDPIRFRRPIQLDRALLFVAATRARDELVIFWHGAPSRFLSTMSVGKVSAS
ncbi:3'-5' exonuclease [Amycolatopsis sp. CA-126428]|uniref:3'-5' exonuclease n=1 Tax=Amycolatopsis sp. CA-126428 TaxID=2073158 RepID=UPI000CD28048|nr:3'-5' exonuclease [Amycolatopsis sp. CA-126428]